MLTKLATKMTRPTRRAIVEAVGMRGIKMAMERRINSIIISGTISCSVPCPELLKCVRSVRYLNLPCVSGLHKRMKPLY